MAGYGQFCPIAVACETFAERWTPLILRELLGGARRFNEIRRCIPLISRTLLTQRLRELRGRRGRREPAAPPRPGPGVPADARGGGVPRGPGAARRLGPAVGHRPVRPREPRPGAPHVERQPAHRPATPAGAACGRPLRVPQVPAALPRLRDMLARPRAHWHGPLPEGPRSRRRPGRQRRRRGHRARVDGGPHVPAGGAGGRPRAGGPARPRPGVSDLAPPEPLRPRRAPGARRVTSRLTMRGGISRATRRKRTGTIVRRAASLLAMLGAL